MPRLFIQMMPHGEKEGRLVALELPSLETVAHLKDAVGLKLGVPTSMQVLVYGGSILPNHANLSESGVIEGSCLMLFLPSSSPCELANANASTACNPAARLCRLISPALMRPLLEVGFPEPRVVKALLLNMLNSDLAMEWLLEHTEDPEVDEPLSRAQLFQIARTFSLSMHGHQPVPADIEKAIENNLCTYTVTKNRYAPQQYRYCFTCNLTDGKGCCISCAQVCHAGHNLSPPIHSDSFFCDCGSGDVPHPCKALGLPLKEPSPACVAALAAAEAECKQSSECKMLRLVRSCARNRKYTPCVATPALQLNKDNTFDFFNQRDFSCVSGDVQTLIRELEKKCCECYKPVCRRKPTGVKAAKSTPPKPPSPRPPPPTPISTTSLSTSSSSLCDSNTASTTSSTPSTNASAATCTSLAAGLISTLRSSASSFLPSCPFSADVCAQPSAFCGLNVAEREKIKSLLTTLSDGPQFHEGETQLLAKILGSDRATKENVLKFFSTLTLFPKGMNFFDMSPERTLALYTLAQTNEETLTSYLAIYVNFASRLGDLKCAGNFQPVLKLGQTATTTPAKVMLGALLSNLCLWLVHGQLLELCPELVQNLFMVLKKEYDRPELMQDALVSLAVLVMGCKQAKTYCAQQGARGMLEPLLGVKANDVAIFAHMIVLLLETS